MSDVSSTNIERLGNALNKSLVVDGSIRAKAKADPAQRKRPTSRSLPWTIEGFAGQTRVATSFGDVPCHLLRKNDMLRTKCGTFRKITWIDHVHLDEDFMSRHPEANPILIRAGALGGGLPARDIEVSPCHKLQFGHVMRQGGIRADSLLGRPGVVRSAKFQVTYTLFRCETDAIVKVENIWAEIQS